MVKINKIISFFNRFYVYLFVFGIVLGLFLWNYISLPFKNQFNVVGKLTKIGFNPINNTIRFLILIILPSLFLIIHFLYRRPKEILNSKALSINTEINQNRYVIYLILIFSIFFALNNPSYHSSGLFDTFHEGETLGSVMLYEKGLTPYKDFIFCHGLFQDPLRAHVAFSLFGKSIASVRIIESILKVLMFILMSVFILKLCKNNYFLSILVLLIYTLISPFIIFPSRDIVSFIYLILILFMRDQIINKECNSKFKFSLLVFLYSFFPFITFLYSIDKGFYLSAVFLITIPILYIFFIRETSLKIIFLIFSFLGIAVAGATLYFFFRKDLYDFFKYAFIIMPQYKELTDGLVFPLEKGFAFIFLFSVLLYWFVFRFIYELYVQFNFKNSLIRFFENYFIEFIMFIMALFFYRSALGRSDWEHIRYSNAIICLLTIYIISRYYLLRIFTIRKAKSIILIVFFLLTSFLGIRIYAMDLIKDNFPIGVSDSSYMPDNFKNTVSFLKGDLKEDQSFITLTFEASWYYFVNKPCPIRFPVLWFAEPDFYQRDVIVDIKNKNVKYIILNNDFTVDLIKNEERLPILVNFIHNKYQYYKTIDNNQIWIRKDYLVH
jgi:hypothetical protein